MRKLLLPLLILSLASCNSRKGPDVSNIKTPVTIGRFDKAFFSIDTNNLNASLASVEQQYSSFFKVYTDYLSPLSYMTTVGQLSARAALSQYLKDVKPLYQASVKQYPDLKETETFLSDHFRYIKYYYPKYKLPAVMATVESLNPENKNEIYGTSYFSDTIALSLQLFLGKDYPGYDPTYYFDYLRRRFEAAYMGPNVVRAIAETISTDSTDGASLIEQMINKGKAWYMMKKFMPDVQDSLITFYTKNQLEWAKENEGNIWGFISKQTDIYTLDPSIIQNYIGEAPFTAGMIESASPGNLGPWIGWKILEKYESAHPDQSLPDIITMPAKKIYTESGYHPK